MLSWLFSPRFNWRFFLPASRPEDVEDVKFVINYDYPNSSEDYVHRIGRTARSTNKGTAYTFFTPGNLRQARDLVRVLEEARQAINPKLLQLVDSGRGGGGGENYLFNWWKVRGVAVIVKFSGQDDLLTKILYKIINQRLLTSRSL